MIREEGVPDTLRIGGVLTDMLATNLARVAGLSVLANSRLFELMLPGQDTLVSGYSTAARSAGASEILQGRLLPGPDWSLALEIQRVDLETGLVKGGYRVSAADRYALIDSMTAAIARDLRLRTPGGSVSEATTDSPVAYRLYEEGLRAFYQYDAAAAKRLMEAALLEDTTFAMAAYYLANLSYGDATGTIAGLRALRLAARVPERQRLRITAHTSLELNDPLASVYAESLVTKYPNDPRAIEILSRAQATRGDWAGAAVAIERAIAIDSASEPVERQDCRLCSDLIHLAGLYHAQDSLPAADRTARRLLRLRPKTHGAWNILLRTAAARGDSAAFHSHFRRFHETNPLQTAPQYRARYQTLLEAYDEAGRELEPLLDSPRQWEGIDSRWVRTIGLRNQGRLAEALTLARVEPGPNDIAEAMIALERGTPAGAVEIFARRARADQSIWAPGVQARQHAWANTLLGMAFVAAGDTTAVRRLADTVASWGQRSNFGRDRRLHHYLLGMLLVAQGRDAEAAPELERAIFSSTHGFTRVNYELGRVLLRLNRPAEAVPVVRAALHGDLDGANLYMTRTDLHELLAQAFDKMGARDSAMVHYRAVVRAWERADPLYHARRDSARAWLARQDRAQ
jgi:tetratricopeptide (TPR) repeat protein